MKAKRKRITFEGFDRLSARFIKRFIPVAITSEMLNTKNFGAGEVAIKPMLDDIMTSLIDGAMCLVSEYKMHPHKDKSGQHFDIGHVRFHLIYEFYVDRVKSDPKLKIPDVECDYVEFKLLIRWKKKPGMKKIASMKVNLGTGESNQSTVKTEIPQLENECVINTNGLNGSNPDNDAVSRRIVSKIAMHSNILTMTYMLTPDCLTINCNPQHRNFLRSVIMNSDMWNVFDLHVGRGDEYADGITATISWTDKNLAMNAHTIKFKFEQDK